MSDSLSRGWAQFFDRIKLFGMPAKHQPDLIYLRYVPLWKVHVFTIVQVTCLVLLWVIKASAAAVIFPMMVTLSLRGRGFTGGLYYPVYHTRAVHRLCLLGPFSV